MTFQIISTKTTRATWLGKSGTAIERRLTRSRDGLRIATVALDGEPTVAVRLLKGSWRNLNILVEKQVPADRVEAAVESLLRGEG